MNIIKKNHDLIDKIIKISKKAGQSILEIYYSNPNYHIKDDKTPVTEADIESHRIISQELNKITPKIPILSEEQSEIAFDIRSSWKRYWLVDPLDGTKEFIKRNDEFTVNIALIENHIPIIGLIHNPVLNSTYWGSELGAFFSKGNNDPTKISVNRIKKINPRIICSRSHKSDELEVFLQSIGKHQIINAGSSLKFCSIASGDSDIYPRFNPTSEWDTAAGQCIVESAGGFVKTIDGERMQYNKKRSLINPGFICYSGRKDKNIEQFFKIASNFMD